jgi:predicted flavoprotein YhiN
MKSKVAPGLDLNCKVRDRDCRVGGLNFQWAWATDSMAGRAVSANVRAVSGVYR